MVHPWNDGEIGTISLGNARGVALPFLFPDATAIERKQRTEIQPR